MNLSTDLSIRRQRNPLCPKIFLFLVELDMCRVGVAPSLGLIDKLLLEHVGLPHVLDNAVHLVNFFDRMSQGGHYEPLLLLALFY